MSNTYTEKAEQVDRLLAELRIDYHATYAGQSLRDKWECDQWRIRFSLGNGFEVYDYYTGLGLRKKTGQKPEGYPQAPKAVDVLHSLVLDASAIDMSFHDWCADYGYDNDSIKAFDTYRACCDTAQKLRRIFNRDQLAKLRPILEDL